MNKKYTLDAYEQDIDENFDKHVSRQKKIKFMEEVAKSHVKNRRPITLRVAVTDIEAIKVKASKCGLPYQTYLNMIIHRDATSI